MSQKIQKNVQIIQAATQEFLAKGFQAASMHRIAEKAKVSKRTLYKYYSSKKELYTALIDNLLESIHGLYQIEYAKDELVSVQIEKIIEDKINLSLSLFFLNMSKIVMGEMLRGHRPSELQLEKMYASELRFVAWIDAAKKDGTICEHPSSSIMADQFHAIIKSQVFWPVLFGLVEAKNIDPKVVKRTVLDFFESFVCEH